jgi:hypothetical protein
VFILEGLLGLGLKLPAAVVVLVAGFLSTTSLLCLRSPWQV